MLVNYWSREKNRKCSGGCVVLYKVDGMTKTAYESLWIFTTHSLHQPDYAQFSSTIARVVLTKKASSWLLEVELYSSSSPATHQQ